MKKWMGTTPSCDFCGDASQVNEDKVFFDAATTHGPWACMCTTHFRSVGLWMGQKYDLKNGDWLKTADLAKK
jgi:hypothetical protein